MRVKATQYPGKMSDLLKEMAAEVRGSLGGRVSSEKTPVQQAAQGVCSVGHTTQDSQFLI